jgi:hypothetical protein
MSYQNIAELKAAIAVLEAQKKLQQQELVQHFQATKESLKPANLFRAAVGNIDKSGVLNTVIKTASTIGAGLIAGKLVGGSTAVASGQGLLRFFLKQAASSGILSNKDKIKAYGTAIYNNLFAKKDKPA